MEQLFTVTLTLRTSRTRKEAITESEVLAAVTRKLTGSSGPVITSKPPTFRAEDWDCIAMHGRIRER